MLEAAHILVVGLVRRSWFVAVVAIITCAAFAAHAVAALVEARYLGPSATGAPPPARGPELPRARPKPDGQSFVERDMFCSTCSTAFEPGSTDAFVPAAILIATTLGNEPRATVRVPGSEVQGSWGIGELIPGVGTIADIGWVSVEIVDATGRHGHLSLVDRAIAKQPVVYAPASPWADRVRKIDDHTYEVDRSLVRELVSGAVRPGSTRATAVSEGGKLVGLRILGAGESSLGGALGLHNGDVLSELNGKHIESANTLLELYGQLDQLNVVEIDGTRGGKALALTLRLR